MIELKQALEEGRIYINAEKRTDYDPTKHSGGFHWEYADSMVRALMERVERIAALEAEVELMADKISAAVILRMVEHVSRPTPAEIAARVEQNRKE